MSRVSPDICILSSFDFVNIDLKKRFIGYLFCNIWEVFVKLDTQCLKIRNFFKITCISCNDGTACVESRCCYILSANLSL
jgi:hypothetical protein